MMLGMSGIARLAAIYRYPVKGLAGRSMPAVRVTPDDGLPGDREFAITSGHGEPPEDGSWVARRAFRHLARNPELAALHETFDPGVDGAADGDAARLSTAVSRLYSGGGTRIVRAAHGYWDCADATVSLVNLRTVGELAELAGRDIDPLRLRANLYLTGLDPWAELGMIGKRLRIGDAELEILRPIGRCRATSVDPGTGATDLNVPALLALAYGHICCGVYARVVAPGRLVAGQPLTDLTGSPHEPVPVGPRALIAAAPRLATVVGRVRESVIATSLWLRDPADGLSGDPVGRHIRVHTTDSAGPLWRSYTVSAARQGSVRISVKREDRGRMSRLLHESTPEGARILISGPFGDAPLPTRPILLGSAGIGITPVVALLHRLVRRRHPMPVLVCHTARSAAELTLWPELRSLLDQLPAASAVLHLTRPKPGDGESLDALPGRPSLSDIASRRLRLPDAEALLCGPLGFIREHGDALRAAGMAPDRLRYEVFASPQGTAGTRKPPPDNGPFRVSFARSNTIARWTPDAGTLLDLAEDVGLSPPSGCREGACHTCLRRVHAGSTTDVLAPVLDPPSGSALLCCAVPTSDVTVDA